MTKNESYTLKKEERLSSKKMIDSLFSKGKSFLVYPLRIIYLPVLKENPEEPAVSVLMSVSKKRFKAAVKRNKVKRLMRESYRKNKQILCDPLNQTEKRIIVAFIYLDNEIKDYSFTEKKMIEALIALSIRIK